jgi:tetratricopeptide (TPR) repeat protein
MDTSAIRCVNNFYLALATMLLGHPALADENSAKCTNQDNSFSLVQQIDGCTAVVLAHPPSKKYLASAYYLRGKAYQELQDYDRAIADYDEVISLDSEFTAIFFRRGLAYYKKRDYGHAIIDFNNSISINPQDAQSFTSRGLAYRGKQDYDHAIADYNRAISLDPQSAYAYSNRGDVYFDKRDYDHAIADYSEALRIDPRHAAAFCSRGALHSLKKDYAQAAKDYSDAIRLDPKDAHAVLNLYLARARADPAHARAALASDAKKLNRSHWPYPVVELFLGSRTAEATLEAAVAPETKCEAQSYIGEWRLLRGDSAALASMKEASDACANSAIENLGVRSALQQLRQDVNALAPTPETAAPIPAAKTAAPSSAPKVSQKAVGKKDSRTGRSASRDAGERAPKSEQAAPDFLALKDKVSCAISSNLGKISALFFSQHERRPKRRSRSNHCK